MVDSSRVEHHLKATYVERQTSLSLPPSQREDQAKPLLAEIGINREAVGWDLVFILQFLCLQLRDDASTQTKFVIS